MKPKQANHGLGMRRGLGSTLNHIFYHTNTKIALKPFEGEKWFSSNVMQFLRSQNVICCRMYYLHNYWDTLKLYHQVKFSFSFELIIYLKRILQEISVMKQKQMLRNE